MEFRVLRYFLAVAREQSISAAAQALQLTHPTLARQLPELGVEVREAFMAVDAKASAAFIQHGDKYLADIYQLARQRLANVGVEQIFGGDRCTYTENETFFSYRRDKTTGRMASFIWLI